MEILKTLKLISDAGLWHLLPLAALLLFIAWLGRLAERVVIHHLKVREMRIEADLKRDDEDDKRADES